MHRIFFPSAFAAFLSFSACVKHKVIEQPIVDFLSGCWISEDGVSKEVWIPEGDRIMFGHGLTIEDDQIVFFEQLYISKKGKKLFYVAAPFGKDSTLFTMVKRTSNTIRFENAAHDYPQEIEYKRNGKTLEATISLLGGKDPNTFKKIQCS